MPAEHIFTDKAPKPLPVVYHQLYTLLDWLMLQYSQAVRAGNYVYTSGSVGMTVEGKMAEGTVRIVLARQPSQDQ